MDVEFTPVDKKILVNKIRTPDGTILQSHFTHDFKTHLDKNGEEYMVDGGLSYLRRSLNKHQFEELSLFSDDDHKLIRDNFSWGTRGVNGDQPLTRIVLKDMTSEHIDAILETQTHIPKFIRNMFEDELDYRDEHNCHIWEDEE